MASSVFESLLVLGNEVWGELSDQSHEAFKQTSRGLEDSDVSRVSSHSHEPVDARLSRVK